MAVMMSLTSGWMIVDHWSRQLVVILCNGFLADFAKVDAPKVAIGAKHDAFAMHGMFNFALFQAYSVVFTPAQCSHKGYVPAAGAFMFSKCPCGVQAQLG